jgi:hypothetical protein
MLPGEETPQSQPLFLPVKKPSGSGESGPRLPEQVRKLWVDLRDVIQDEEEVVGRYDISFEQLQRRYEGFPVPEASRTVLEHDGEDLVMQEGGAVAEEEVGRQTGGRRTSLNRATAIVPGGDEDVAMQGTDRETVGRLPSSTHIYRPDPRKQR